MSWKQAIRAFCLTLSVLPLCAQNYTLSPVALDEGGLAGKSRNYSINSSTHAGGAGDSADYNLRTGFAGQLEFFTTLEVSLSPTSLNETTSGQLNAELVSTDGTRTALAANDVFWSIHSGPLLAITLSGIATASPVYQNTAASIQAVANGVSGELTFTVNEAIPDNFPSYAGDGLPDTWQIDYFGLDNPLAGPFLDPDGDGQNNVFEFTSGLVPTDALSHFSFSVKPVPNEPEQTRIVFDPIVAGRSYTVMISPDLSPDSWNPLSGGNISDDGDQRTVTDTNSGQTTTFYKLKIEKP